MAITTYAELQTAVDNWLARTDLAGRSPEFIALAEARMSRELETQSQEKRVVSTMTADDAYVTLPPDARQIRSVRLNTNPISVLQFQSPTAADDNFPGTGTGKPKYYSVVGGELYFRPSPDDSYQAEILYVGSVSALSDTNTSNTILSRHPDLYLHGTLAEAFGYLMDEQRQAQHDALFTRTIAAVNADEDRVKYGGSPLTVQTQYGEIQ